MSPTFNPAEVEPLCDGSLLSTLQAVRGENERLREALTTIAVSGNGSHWGRLARQALSTIQNGGGEGGDFNADLSSD